MKRIVFLVSLLCLVLLVGCSSETVKNSADATAENPLVLKLPHNMNEQHTVHIALQEFANQVFTESEGRIRIDIYPNAQLGSENEVMEQLMAGVIPMTKVSAPVLATYNESYHAFGLPFLFDDTEHYYRCMESDVMREFFLATADSGFIGLTYYTSGSRSFYTVNKEINTPEDLKGLKIRVQDMKSQTDMVKALGGTPVAMAYGDVYTALQTGIIDGTENNETALTMGKHGEVCKVFTLSEHTMIPDMLVMSSKVWEQLSEADRELLIRCSESSTQSHKLIWEVAIDEAVVEAEEMGVVFVTDIDKQPFREATKDMIEVYKNKYPKVRTLLDAIADIE